jgi:hypothetical protein
VVYAAVLGVAFSATENPLPVRGAAAAVFLGLSVALATAYLAYVTQPVGQAMYAGGASLSELQLNRTNFFAKWIDATVNDRRWALRASVFSLAIGVAFIPAPLIATHRVQKIPAAPVAPAIPGVVASEVSSSVTESFKAQTKSYDAAVKERDAAIASASKETQTVAKDEKDANELTLFLGLAGLGLVCLGPVLIYVPRALSRGWSWIASRVST